MPITPSCCFPARHAAYFCSDVMSKQMKAIGYGRQSQESQQLGQLLLCPALPCCFWQTNNIFGNKQKFMPPNPDPSCLFSSLLTTFLETRGIPNYLQQLPSSSTEAEAAETWQLPAAAATTAASAGRRVFNSAISGFDFPWKSCPREAQLRLRHAVIRLKKNQNVTGSECVCLRKYGKLCDYDAWLVENFAWLTAKL